MSKLRARYPLEFGKTVREDRRLAAEFYKDYKPEDGALPVCPDMSQRRVKKAWAKHLAGKPLGNKESRLVGYYQCLECQDIEAAMLRNAY